MSAPGPYFGSQITWNGNGWNLRLRDGTVYTFPNSDQQTNKPAKSALLAVQDRFGNRVTIVRDSTNGNITQITSPNGRWLQFQHDASNRITQIQDNLNRTVTYTYNNYSASGRATCSSAGMLCAVTDPNGGVTSFTYDAGDRMLTMTDPLGNVTFTNQYDTAGRVKQQTLADGTSIWQFTYTLDSNGNVSQTSITNPNGVVSHRSFMEFFDPGSSNYTGFITSDVEAYGKTDQQTTTYAYDSNNRVTSTTDQLNRVTSYTYDAVGNILSITRLSGTSQAVTTNYSYEPVFNQLTAATDPLSHTWTLNRDNLGNLTSLVDPLSHSITLTYNGIGPPLTVADTAGNTAHFGYNFGDLTSVTDPAGNVSSLFTDSAGRTTSATDPLGKTTSFAYDVLDRLTRITDANGGTTGFGYDLDSNLKTVTDAKNNQTSYTYDARNRRTLRQDALTNQETYSYDANGNLTQFTDRRGKVSKYQYDGLNRRTFAGFGWNGSSYVSTVTYTLDGGNRLTQAVDTIAGTFTRSWDGLDRLTQEAAPQGTINYSYDNANRRSTMQVVGQSQVAYTWDNGNRLTGLTQGSSTVGFVYDNANRRTCLTLPNGVLVSYGYDRDSHVNSMNYGTGGSCASPPSNLGGLTYSYDADGRRTAIGGSFATVTLPANVAGGSSTTYNADNEQTKFNGTSLSYDNNGNLTGDGTNTYTFDSRNHLSAISGGTSASFVYDPFGRRTSKTIGSTTTQFLYDGWNPVQELVPSTPPAPPLPLANVLTGLGIDEYLQRSDAVNGTLTFMTDALGSPLALTNSSGTITTSYTYEPFGKVSVANPPLLNPNPYQFTGRENDGTGLYFYRARYYSATFQRFVAQDPIGFAGGDANLYGYVQGNPISENDPLGWAEPPPGVPYPPNNIPGGPWEWSPNPQNSRGGDFIGPKPPGGGPRDRCTYAPKGENNPNPYWKKTDPNGQTQRYDENGNPKTPEEAHPGPTPEGESGDSNSQFQLPPPPRWLYWIVPFLAWLVPGLA